MPYGFGCLGYQVKDAFGSEIDVKTCQKKIENLPA
jgi:hypothetical protein